MINLDVNTKQLIIHYQQHQKRMYKYYGERKKKFGNFRINE